MFINKNCLYRVVLQLQIIIPKIDLNKDIILLYPIEICNLTPVKLDNQVCKSRVAQLSCTRPPPQRYSLGRTLPSRFHRGPKFFVRGPKFFVRFVSLSIQQRSLNDTLYLEDVVGFFIYRFSVSSYLVSSLYPFQYFKQQIQQKLKYVLCMREYDKYVRIRIKNKYVSNIGIFMYREHCCIGRRYIW